MYNGARVQSRYGNVAVLGLAVNQGRRQPPQIHAYGRAMYLCLVRRRALKKQDQPRQEKIYRLYSMVQDCSRGPETVLGVGNTI